MTASPPTSDAAPSPADARSSNRGRLALLAALALAAALLIAFAPLGAWQAQLLDAVRDLGVWGPVIVVVVYILACVLFLPGSILTLGAGYVFGLGVGLPVVIIGSVAGAALAFLVGRTLARNAIEERVAGNARFAAIDAAVAREGFKIVLLTRLSPVLPFNLLNFAFGITQVRFRDYVLGSLIGMFPGTVLYVYLGTAVKSVQDLLAGNVEGGVAQKVFLAVGLVVTLVVTVYVTRVARRALAEATDHEAIAPKPPPA